MKIKLCKENYDKINYLLLSINGKDTEHTIIDVDEIKDAINLAKQDLHKAGLTGCNQQGIKLFIVSSFNKVPSWCRYIRWVTQVTVYRGKEHWFIIDIKKLGLFPSQLGGITLLLTEQQKEHFTPSYDTRLCKVI